MEKFTIKKPEFVVKTIRLPRELFDRMNQLVRQQHISLNKLIVQCCEFALDHMEESPA